MTDKELAQFPQQSVNDAGQIVDLQLWVDEFERYFDDSILYEIRTTIQAGLHTAPYILISCAIDFLVTFWAGSESTPRRYKDFVNTFFSGYNGNLLYRELRCRMVHNLTVGDRTIVCWNEPDIHKRTTTDGTVVINLEQFFDDFIGAKNRYIAALRSTPDLLRKHIKRFNDIGVLARIDADAIRTQGLTPQT